MVQITVENHYCGILGLNDNQNKLLDALLSYLTAGAIFSPAYRMGRWDGKTHLYNKTKKVFKTGLLFRVIKWLQIEEIQYEIIDNRNVSENLNWDMFNSENLYDGIRLRDVQLEAIKKFIELKEGVNLCKGILSMPPRSGKTLTAGVLGFTINQYPIMFIVHKIDLAYQTQKVFEKLFKRKIGIVGDGNYELDSDIVVTTIQSLCSAYRIKTKVDKEDKEKEAKDYTEFQNFINKVKTVFIDECHISAADVFQELPRVLEHCTYIIGLSGTPYREDGDDLLIEQLCGPIVYELTREEAMDRGYILPMTVYFVELPPIKPTAYDWQTQKREVLNLNWYIYDAVDLLVKRLARKDLTSVVIVNERSQGDAIVKKLKCYYLNGSVGGKIREEVYDLLNRRRINTVVSTVTGIGVDLPTLDCVVIPGISKSKIAAFQRVRCNTPFNDKKMGRMFILCPSIINEYDKNGKAKHKDYLLEFTKKLRRIYKKEKMFTIKELTYEQL